MKKLGLIILYVLLAPIYFTSYACGYLRLVIIEGYKDGKQKAENV